jgi:hypothetical protein
MRVAQCIFLLCLVAAVPTAFFRRAAGEDIPEIKANDNRLPCGRLTDGVLTIDLEARVVFGTRKSGTAPRSRYKDSQRLAVRWKFPGR